MRFEGAEQRMDKVQNQIMIFLWMCLF